MAGRPVKETEDSYTQWLLARAGDVIDAEHDLAQKRRQTLREDGLVTESYRRIGVAEALERLASAGLSQAPTAFASVP